MIKAILFFSFLLTAQMSWADPSCSKLNELWPKYHADLNLRGWDETGFSCPSEKSRIAIAMYYLDTLDVTDNSGNEVFDYYSYLTETVRKSYKDQGVANYVSDKYLFIGASLYSVNDQNGNLRPTPTLTGAETFVHERKHMDSISPGHVECNSNSTSKACDEQYYSIIDGEAKVDDNHVGAFSISVAYIIDVYQNAKSHDLNKAAFRILLQSRLTNNFKPSGITNKQVTDALKKVDAL